MLDWILDKEFNFASKNIEDFSLENIKKALSVINNPHLKLKNIIHIAGTNGKGSTATFIHSILRKSGYKACLYTSPHIQKFSERIKINDNCITDEELDKISQYCKERISYLNLTFFEITTIIALIAFEKSNSDFVILETGLGGRLDATNIFDNKLCSILTSISLDHQAILGQTLAEITKEKSGIINGSKYVFTSSQGKNLEILEIIKEKSAKSKSKCFINGEMFFANGRDESKFYFRFPEYNYEIRQLESGISGFHQIENSSIAIACCIILKNHENAAKITDTSIKIGIKSAYIAGRIERINSKIVQKILPNNHKNIILYIDGSHNQDSISKLSDYITNLSQNSTKIGIFSCLMDKNKKEICNEISKMNLNHIYITQISSSQRAENVEKIYQNMQKYTNIQSIKVKQNLQEIFLDIDKNKINGNIFLFGSMFFLSDFYNYIS